MFRNTPWMPAASTWPLRAFWLTCDLLLPIGFAFGAENATPIVVNVDQLPKRVIVEAGETSPGQTLAISLLLNNALATPSSESSMPLSIRSASSDCGCLQLQHDPGRAADDRSPTLQLQLAPSRKLGRIRRNVRVFFDQAPTSPLDIGLDTLVVGPIRFHAATVSITDPREPVEIAGSKSSPNVEIIDCAPTRGSCRVLEIQQSEDRFELRAQPLISFGSASELFRVRYRPSPGAEPVLVDLPLEFRSASPLRFFPSVATLRQEEGSWRSSAKLVLAPGNQLNFEQLQLSIEREDGSLLDPSDYRIDLLQTSAVLYVVHLQCAASRHGADRPARLNVASPNGQRLATLDFTSP